MSETIYHNATTADDYWRELLELSGSLAEFKYLSKSYPFAAALDLGLDAKQAFAEACKAQAEWRLAIRDIQLATHGHVHH